MLCDRLHAWWLTQSLLTTLQTSPVGQASDLMMAPAYSFQLSWLGPDDLSLVGLIGVLLLDFCCSSVSELVCSCVLVLFHLSDES